MSADTLLPKKASSTDKYTKNLYNSCSPKKRFKDEEHKSKSILKITITKHLCIPCPRLYTDIFNAILIICKDPSHNQDVIAEDNHINDKIERFLESNNKNPSENNNHNFNVNYDNTITDFYRESLLNSSKTAKRTGTKKLSNLVIGENCNQITDQAITDGGNSNGH